jgi:hypothetical protein
MEKSTTNQRGFASLMLFTHVLSHTSFLQLSLGKRLASV